MTKEIQIGSIRIFTRRGGTVREISGLLHDIEDAYNKIFIFSLFVDFLADREAFLIIWRRYEFAPLFWTSFVGFPKFEFSEIMLPEHKLEIKKIQIESPGFWEFLGALNPLQQIREYLNDRHKRRQDREYREQAERERLALENELILRQIWEKENSIFREKINMLREIGFSDEQIRRFIWNSVSRPLIELSKHQDSGLIENADSK